MASEARDPSNRSCAAVSGPTDRPMVHHRWFVPAVVAIVCWSLTTHGKYSVSGDEPHYLMIAESLWRDGDLDLRNNYQENHGRRFGVEQLEPDLHALPARDGRLLSVHDLGLPLLLLPAYVGATAVAAQVPESTLRRFRMNQGLFAYSLLTLVMIGITATAAGLTRSALVAAGAAPALASATVLTLWLSPPLLSNSFLLFPEPVALLATAWALVVATRPALGVSQTLVFAGALGLLPWFHRKFAVYAAALLLAVALVRRARHEGATSGVAAAALVIFSVPSIVLAFWMWSHWGHVGGALVLERAPFSLNALRNGSLGLLVDRENGLLVWAPVYLLLPLAWGCAWRRNWPWLLPALSLYILSAAHDLWWGGFSPAGRFLVPLVPLAAFVAVPALGVPLVRIVCLALIIPQAAISAYGWQYPRALWPQGDGENRVVGTLLSWLGGSDRVLPALRSAPAETGRALVMLVTVAAANLGMWLALRTRPMAGQKGD
jgi:hypothetical protein